MPCRPTVLLVEDDWFIATNTSRCLEAEGFEVVMKATAEDALAVLKDRADSIKAMVTDVRLAGPMCGITLAHQAARCWPWLALLVVSAEGPERLAERPASCDALPKPYEPKRIAAKLRVALFP